MKQHILVITFLFLTKLSFSQKSEWIHFDWHGENIFGKYYEKLAISLPLKIEKLPYNFCCQLDLGATKTLFYGKSLKNYSISIINQKLDSLGEPYYLNGNKGNFLRNIDLKIDKKDFPKTDVAYIYDYGDEIPKDSINSLSQKLIGTIAPDLFQNKYLVIDFPNQKMRIYEELPKKYKKADFVNVLMRKGRIKIPLTIGNKTEYVIFDTGNCLGDLLLDKETINLFTNPNDSAIELLSGKSWGQNYIVYQKKILEPVLINNKKTGISTAQFTNSDDDVQFNKEEKIIGLIGPLFFIDQTVIIDYKNLKFGTLK
ncbi:hypothetical protein [Flavobacterium sp.]|uniref:hypothetical protein n=1 Tax=Flavobacterium sp. TaxID=239 RepID=UPI00261C5247|nr:hypothetical protein [Flavobacterium sp.]